MSRAKFAKRKEKRRKIALERIRILMDLAEEAAKAKKIERASRYMHLARRIGSRYNVRLPKGHKLLSCRKCGVYRVSGTTSRTRTIENRLVVTCLKCGEIYRRPIKIPIKQPVGD